MRFSDKEKVKRLEDIKKFAVSCGGQCLSDEYINRDIKLKFRCGSGHEWLASPKNVVHCQSWCPHCSGSRAEELCRSAIEALTGHKFMRCRPEWLTNSAGNRLELDGYCPKLKVAFECNGKHHTQFSKAFHRTPDALKAQLKRDKSKNAICRRMGVLLITIDADTQESALLQKLSLELNGRCALKRVTKLQTVRQGKLEELTQLAKNRGGELLSTIYLGLHSKLKWYCSMHKFTWEADTNHVMGRGQWCPKCANTRRGRRKLGQLPQSVASVVYSAAHAKKSESKK